MFERFTKPARRVVETAVASAEQARADEVRPEHLLLAVLADEECVAVRAVERLGVTPGQVRAQLDRLRTQYGDGLDADDADALHAIGIDLGEVVRRIESLGGSSDRRRRGWTRFSRGSKKALELALREAIHLKHSHIGTEHILLGLARADDRIVSDTLGAAGLDWSSLRRAVDDALREAG